MQIRWLEGEEVTARAEMRPGRMDESVTQCVLGDCGEASTLVRDLSGCITLELNWVSCKLTTRKQPFPLSSLRLVSMSWFWECSGTVKTQSLPGSQIQPPPHNLWLPVSLEPVFCKTKNPSLDVFKNFSILWISLQLVSSHLALKNSKCSLKKIWKWSRKKTKKHP